MEQMFYFWEYVTSVAVLFYLPEILGDLPTINIVIIHR